MAEVKICHMRLKRLSEAEREMVEIQYRATLPKLGDVIEVAVEKKPVRGRVVHVTPPPGKAGIFYVDLDEELT